MLICYTCFRPILPIKNTTLLICCSFDLCGKKNWFWEDIMDESQVRTKNISEIFTFNVFFYKRKFNLNIVQQLIAYCCYCYFHNHQRLEKTIQDIFFFRQLRFSTMSCILKVMECMRSRIFWSFLYRWIVFHVSKRVGCSLLFWLAFRTIVAIAIRAFFSYLLLDSNPEILIILFIFEWFAFTVFSLLQQQKPIKTKIYL